MVETILKRVGKTCFINCFDDFRAGSNGKSSVESLMGIMYKKGGAKTEHSARTKARNGLSIFDLGLVKQALTSVVIATRVDKVVVEKASNLLKFHV